MLIHTPRPEGTKTKSWRLLTAENITVATVNAGELRPTPAPPYPLPTQSTTPDAGIADTYYPSRKHSSKSWHQLLRLHWLSTLSGLNLTLFYTICKPSAGTTLILYTGFNLPLLVTNWRHSCPCLRMGTSTQDEQRPLLSRQTDAHVRQ